MKYYVNKTNLDLGYWPKSEEVENSTEFGLDDFICFSDGETIGFKNRSGVIYIEEDIFANIYLRAIQEGSYFEVSDPFPNVLVNI